MDERPVKYTTAAQAQATTRLIAMVFLGIGWAAAYWLWPDGVMDAPLAAMTMRTLLWILASAVAAVATLIMAILIWI